MSEEILKKIRESRIFITKDAINELQDYVENNIILYSKFDKIIKELAKFELVTKDIVKRVCEEAIKEEEKIESKQVKPVQKVLSFKELDLDTGYLGFVQDRYFKLKHIIERLNSIRCNVDTANISKALNRSIVRISGVLNSKKSNKFGSLILNFEDINDFFIAIIPNKNKNLMQKAKELEEGDVVVIEGELIKRKDSSFYIRASRIFETDAEWVNYKNDKNGFVVFISDLRFGNKNFAEDKFLRFIDFLNGKVPEYKEISSNILALIITGDLVEGLALNKIFLIDESYDIKKQYDYAASMLSKIDKSIPIYILPGERDVILPFIPFTGFKEEYAESLYKLENVKLVNDPSFLNIDGLHILITHGFYFESIYRKLLGTYNKENSLIQTVRKILKRRELIPNLEIKGILPIGYDPFVIQEMPHVLAFGHYNLPIYDIYKNCLIISNSSWLKTNEFGCTAYLVDISNRDFRRIVF